MKCSNNEYKWSEFGNKVNFPSYNYGVTLTQEAFFEQIEAIKIAVAVESKASLLTKIQTELTCLNKTKELYHLHKTDLHTITILKQIININ